MVATATVRVTAEDRATLARIARERGITTPAVVGELVRREVERLEVQGWARDVHAMSPTDVATYRTESAEWDETVADGLGDVPE